MAKSSSVLLREAILCWRKEKEKEIEAAYVVCHHMCLNCSLEKMRIGMPRAKSWLCAGCRSVRRRVPAAAHKSRVAAQSNKYFS
eukprot:6205326-Pleurochrysis_carterae.AAC.1